MTSLEKALQEIEERLKPMPPGPWKYMDGDALDHWQLWSDHPREGYHLVQDDSGVEPSPDFVKFLIHARTDMELLVKALRRAIFELEYIKEEWDREGSHDTGVRQALKEIEALFEVKK